MRKLKAVLNAAVMKLRGNLPEIGFPDLLLSLYPGVLYNRGVRASQQVAAISGENFWMVERDDDPEFPVTWETRAGRLRSRFSDGALLDYIGSEVFEDRVYDQGPVRVREGDVVLDLGGHLGMFTGFALKQGARRVVVFEANPGNIACLRKSFSKEIAEGRVDLVEAAAWSSPGELNFKSDTNSAQGLVTKNGELRVRAVTVDETVERLELDRVDFIKMDIEGAEREALAGARETVARFGPRMVLCIYHLEDDPDVLPQMALEFQPDYSIIRRKEQIYLHLEEPPARDRVGIAAGGATIDH